MHGNIRREPLLENNTVILIGSGPLLVKCGEELTSRGFRISTVLSSDSHVQSWCKKSGFSFDCLGDFVKSLEINFTCDYIFSIGNFEIIPDTLVQRAQSECINYHYGPLPEYSGVHVPAWAIYHRVDTYGICWHRIGALVDGGDILKRVEVPISEKDTALQLELKCAELAFDGFQELLDDLQNGQVSAEPQGLESRRYFSRLSQFPAEGLIQWTRSAEDIAAQVRATDYGQFSSPLVWPKIMVNDRILAVRRAHIDRALAPSETAGAPGALTIPDDHGSLIVATSSNLLQITELVTLEGVVVSIPDLIKDQNLSLGDSLYSVGDSDVKSLKAPGVKASKATDFWTDSLERFAPTRLPHCGTYLGETQDAAQVELDLSASFKALPTDRPFAQAAVAAWGLFLARAMGTENVHIGLSADPNLVPAPWQGLFAQTVPFLAHIASGQTIAEGFANLCDAADRVQARGPLRRDLIGRNPDLSAHHATGEIRPDVVVDPGNGGPVDWDGGKGPAVIVRILPEEGGVVFDYNPIRILRPRVSQLAQQFQSWCEGLSENWKSDLASVSAVTPAQEKALELFNETEDQSTLEGFLPHLFNDTAAAFAQNTALCCGDETCDYATLNENATRFAHHLQARGITKGDLVGVCLDRSINLVTALLGVHKAGAAYMPIDPNFPLSRIEQMLDDANPSLIVTPPEIPSTLRDWAETCVNVEDAIATQASDAKDISLEFEPDDLAYIIYTSGSAGKPKGVEVTHRNLGNFLKSMQTRPGCGSSDRLLAVTTVSFDIAVLELFLPLISGAEVVIAQPQDTTDGQALLSLIEQHEITMMQATSSTWNLLIQSGWKIEQKISKILCGGEILTRELASQLLPYGDTVFNMYGPTETTVWSSCAQVSDKGEITIGTPISNTQLYVLDESLGLVPNGFEGELYIGGAGVARGYHNAPDLTKAAFVKNPFGSGRVYRTGDLACFRADSDLVVLGRKDSQVKLRGYRIELGEVEGVLSSHDEISSAVVVSRNDQMLAYCIREAAEPTDAKRRNAAQAAGLQEWSGMWDSAYEGAVDDPRFNISGWQNSYDGQRLSDVEMRDWQAASVNRILSYSPRDILEIGAGTGLMLFPLVDRCNSYHAVDASERSIQLLQENAGELENVTCEHRLAHDLPTFADGGPDTVIINSVAQYFPNHEYLHSVISAAVSTMEQGRIIIGDVRNLDWLDVFHADVEAFRAEPGVSDTELQRRITQAVNSERELVLSPDFFGVLGAAIPEITRVEIALRDGEYVNEMSRYRFDVVLHVGNDDRETPSVEAHEWADIVAAGQGGLTEFATVLQSTKTDHLRLCGLGNGRLQDVYDRVAGLVDAENQTEIDWVDPRDLRTLAQEHGFQLALVPSQAGATWKFDAVLYRDGMAPALDWVTGEKIFELSDCANVPMVGQPNRPALGQFLPTWLESRLPGYMIPDFYVELDHYPLTPNGKIDRKALPDPIDQSAEPAVLPKNEMEQKIFEIWSEVLGHDRISANASFFKIGGNSLRVVQVQNALQKVLGRPVSTSVLYEFFTINTLAAHLTGGGADIGKKIVKRRTADQEEPIAVIAMSCRLPGGVDTPKEFWEFLERGGDGIIDVPTDRWDANALYDPDPETRGKSYCRKGGFVYPIDLFDAAFFGISPREARALDPAQRLMLETSWEAFERAGYTMDELRGSQTGVFVGIGKGYHEYGLATAGGLSDLDGYYGTGAAGSTMSGRVSYSFGLEGPSMTVDTACSSSLVATHLACNALREGECELALASGVTLMLSPDLHIEFSRLRGMSPDGRCKSFSSTTDGTGWSEGSAVAILKRLSDAERDGDPIHAIIRGTAVNHAGHSASLTTPSGPAQQRVIRQALANSDLEPGDIDYLEAHGTGTKLGDPIEATSLASVFGGQRQGDDPLWVGSVKSNLGHTQAAAGLAGAFKAILGMQNNRIPKTLHVEEPTPSIDWEGEKMALVLEEQPWLPKDAPRRAGVSSFGIGGTNSHVVLEEYKAKVDGQATPNPAPMPEALPFVLSGFSEGALQAQAEALHLHLGMNIQDKFGDIAASLAQTRTHFRKRMVLMAKNKSDLLDGLAAFARTGETPGGAVRSSDNSSEDPQVAMLFTGQGSQLAQMGKELYDTYPVFQDALDEITGKFDQLEKPLLKVMFAKKGSKDAKLLDRTDFTQPALFALEVALFRLWRSWGVIPDFVLGHSIGEISAAHVAGVFDLDDACRLVAARGRLMEALPAGGGMASIQATEDEVLAAICELSLSDTLNLAGLNAPEQTVVSGAEKSVDKIVAHFAQQDRKATKLVVSHAFHSYLLDDMLDDYRAVAGSIRLNAPDLALISTVTGEMATTEELTDPEYWVQQARKAVRFNDAMQTLRGQGAHLFLELGPQPVLSGLGAACFDGDSDLDWMPSLNREQQDSALVLKSLGQLHVLGVAIDWQGYFAPFGTGRVELPTYAFQKDRYWLEESSDREVGAGLTDTNHLLLGGSTQIAGTDMHIFSTVVSTDEPIWVPEHKVMDAVLMPGTAFIEAMRVAGNKVDDQTWDIADVIILAPMVLVPDENIKMQVTVGADSGGNRQVQVYSAPDSDESDGQWQLHAEGRLALTSAIQPESVALPPAHAEKMDVSALYSDLADLGYGYGPTFQGIVEGYHVGSEVWARVELPEAAEPSAIRYGLHPALLDSAMHSLLLTQRLRDEDSDDVFVPFEAERLTMAKEGLAELWVRVASFEMGDGEFWASLDLFDMDGTKVGRLERLHARRIDRAALRKMAAAGVERYQFDLNWHAVDAQALEPAGVWGLMSCGEVDWAEEARDSLEQGGLQVIDVLALEEAQSLDGVICLWDGEGGPLDDASVVARAHDMSHRALDQLHALSESGIALPAIWVTRSAVGTSNDDPVAGLDAAALWGLGRTARNEYLDLNIRNVDVGTTAEDFALLTGALMLADEPECAIRHGQVMIPQLERAEDDKDLLIPSDGMWHLEIVSKGRLDEPLLVKQDVEEKLAGQEVRVEVKATGVNFLDVLNALGMVEIPAFGLECAGVVTDIGSDVKNVAVGDAVMGLARGSFASHVIADARSLTQKPDTLSFEEAATIPMTFLTAWYGLHVLGNMQPGEKVLIHAAAGGVGMAAVQLAQLQGAEVFATASEPKWDSLRQAGLADDHFGSSRDLDFVKAFQKTTGQDKPFDIVLNSLASEFIDASLGLLSGDNSRFLEMGKIDLREQAWIDENYPGVTYSVYNLPEAGQERIQEMLLALAPLFAEGKLKPLPLKTYPINRASDALRFIAQAKHIGKVVLLPVQQQQFVDPDGAVLVTGGVGGLGKFISRWLVTEHGVTDLLLTSRRGLDTSGATDFVAELAELGATTEVIACDVADPDSLAKVMGVFDQNRPLRGVVHTAGVLDDGMLDTMTDDSIDTVFAPKVDGAWNLHRMTRDLELDFFVMYSSVSGIMGTLGQGNYAAANSFLDALAYHRKSKGLPATSVAWGAWDGEGMATDLSDADKARFSRQGMDPLSPEEGLELFDLCVSRDEPMAMAAAFDMGRLQRTFEEQTGGDVPALYRTIFKGAGADGQQSTGGKGDAGLRKALGMAQPEDYAGIMLQTIKEEVAKVLEFASPDDVDVSLGLQDIGLDSLTAVLMRNQLGDVTGLALPAKIAFDHPNLKSLSAYLLERVVESGITPVEDGDGDPQVEHTPVGGGDDLPALPFISDGTLAQDIVFDNVDMIEEVPNGVFLTGATGFVGAFLLNRLLQRDTDVYCLVRAADVDLGVDRLRDALETYGLWQDTFADYLQPVCGDLTQPMFGLPEDEFQWLADSVDVICHAGAIVDWMMPLSSYLDTNVGGTHEVLRLAASGNGKPIHFVSTYATLPKHLGYHVPEDYMDYGYLTSKYMAEKMVAAAQWRGAKASVYRLPFIGACAKTGMFRADKGDFLHNLIAGCIELGQFPDLAGDLRGIISVDYVADVISGAIFDNPQLIGRHYDFANPEAVTVPEYVELVKDAGKPAELRPYDDWLKIVLEVAAADKQGAFARISAVLKILSKAELEEMLRGYPMGPDVLGDDTYPCPKMDADSIRAYVNRIQAEQEQSATSPTQETEPAE